VYDGVPADSGLGESREESAVKRPFCEKPGEGREKASWVAERTLRLPCAVDFEEEKRESNQPMVWWIEGENKVRQGQACQGRGRKHRRRIIRLKQHFHFILSV
jgi:hypothetical protein